MNAIDLMAETMQAMRARLDVATSNLANVSSAGFRKSVSRARLLGGRIVTTRFVDRSPGALHRTGRSLDLAVAGVGAFFVRGADGRPLATRSASLHPDARGYLADDGGRRVLDVAGRPVRADDAAAIDDRGTVSIAGRPIARLMTAPETELRQGFLESPNVDPVGAMVEIIGAQRAYETAEKTLAAADALRQKASADVARVNG